MRGVSGRRFGLWVVVLATGACNGEITPGLPAPRPGVGSDPSGIGSEEPDGDRRSPGSPDVVPGSSSPASPRQTCRAFGPPPLLLEARPVFAGLPLVEPVGLVRPASGGHWYLIERSGQLRRFADRPDVSVLEDALDIGSAVDVRGDGGLLAAAFHPRFSENGQLFLSYTTSQPSADESDSGLRSRLSRFESRDGGRSFGGEKVLLEIDQPDDLHVHLNGDLRFGPDGYLYVGFGDGGPQGDPDGHAQDMGDLRGKILRLDVDAGGDQGYAIPSDNPGPAGLLAAEARPEIYALGLRNPWRFSFDHSGRLLVGDVGFFTAEEVNVVTRGANLGWPIREGRGCAGGAASCPSAGLTAPLVEYRHQGMGASVTGGFVYQGRAVPSLVGRYLYADFTRGEVWAVSLETGGQPELVASTGRRLVSFAEEPDGELLLVDLGGAILRLEKAPAPGASLPLTLSATGCFEAGDPRQPASGLIPYDVRVPFWSDGASKRRFMALPDGTSAGVLDDGRLAFPVGSVLIKEFSLGGRPVETRLFMKYREAQWTGISYVWNPEGTDATLRPEGDILRRSFGDQSWSYPTRQSCAGCHTADRGLGLEVAQLDLSRPDPDGHPKNQLDRLRAAGAIDGQVNRMPRLPGMAGKASLEARARAYLHVNCSMCHEPAGPTPVDMDLRFSTPLAETELCGRRPTEGDLGVSGARRLAPGAPSRSLLIVRMRTIGRGHMPPIGPEQLDPEGAALVESWIAGLSRCP